MAKNKFGTIRVPRDPEQKPSLLAIGILLVVAPPITTFIGLYLGFKRLRAEYTLMAHWNELPRLCGEIKEDHLFVVVTARKGTVSYKHAFEKLAPELQQFYKYPNLMVIYPDQYGEPVNAMTFAAPQKTTQLSIYAQLRDWFRHVPK